MGKRSLFVVVALSLMFALVVPVWAQQTAVRGNLAGTVSDTTGAVIPEAQVTLTGAQDRRTATTNSEGRFTVQGLIPGRYDVKVEKQGFKVAEVKAVEVVIGRTGTLRLTMNPGAATETVEVTASTVSVDTASNAVSANLTDDFYTKVPIQRGVASIFYAAPGVSSGLGTGNSNPSISGGSGLENNYIADGVQINDAAFGGLGVYSRVYGSIGTGINLSFIKEVQVKTAGFEPQYGKSTGGVIQIVTKSGTRDYHGGISAFAAPEWAEKNRLHPDDFARFNKFGKLVGARNYDVTGELSGYVPGMRDHLFFYGSYNPSWAKTNNLPGAFPGPDFERRAYSNNYAGKLTFKLNESNQVEGSVFGDPTSTNNTANRTRNFTNDTVFSKYEFQGRNVVARYNGIWSPTWLFNASWTWNHNDFTENPLAPNVYGVRDELETEQIAGNHGIYQRQGVRFLENYNSDNYGVNFDTTKTVSFGGTHNLSVGYSYGKPHYDNIRFRPGARYTLINVNREGIPLGIDPEFLNAQTDAQFRLRVRADCTVCPLVATPSGLVPAAFQQDRGEFGDPVAKTTGFTHIAFFNDSYSINKYLTLNLGVRYEKQQLEGSTLNYEFPGEWSPRIGVIVDPWGDRKSKFYANFSRLFYHIPLDMAIRSLSNEQDAIGYWFAPIDANGDGLADLDALGNPQPNISVAGVLNSVTGAEGISSAPSISVQAAQGIKPGTRMQYTDEWSVGFERDMGKGVILGARYVDRRLNRIVEDAAGISPEFANAGGVQNYFITNVRSTTDLFVNEKPVTFTPGDPTPPECLDVNGDGFVLDPVEDSNGASLGAACWPSLNTPNTVAWFDPETGSPLDGVLFGGEQQPDGIVDGFPDPKRVYRAVEIEVNKGFAAGWLLRANYRIADLKGNYEGAFRNDNGQSDPSISSLFDFTAGQFGLLGDQFAIGPLNTDRLHTVNGFASYTFANGALKNLTIGSGVRVQSGFPLSELAAHPVYQNAGEIPIGGRGALGRSAVTTGVDFNLAYVAPISEKQRLGFGIDLFNVGNRRTLLLFDQTRDVAFGTPNVDFKKPGDSVSLLDASFQRPFYARFNVRWEF
jgi:hypothetical protein